MCRKKLEQIMFLFIQGEGYEVWIDKEKMSGDIYKGMQEGIDQADVIVVVFSQAYLKSKSCEKECSYAVRTGARMLQNSVIAIVFLLFVC